MTAYGVLLVIISLSFTCSGLASDRSDFAVDESVKWNGPAPHPAKRLSYIETKIVPECEVVYIYYSPKGAAVHSPQASVITSAFCIANNSIGKGANSQDVCEVMNVDWNKGIYKSFYGGSNRLFSKGICTKDNLEKFVAEIKRQSKAMATVDSKFAVISDKLEFKKSYEKK